jgi:hypothetical protein
MKVKLVLLITIFFLSAESVLALGLPTRLYPAKVIKKTIQVIVKKVGR